MIIVLKSVWQLSSIFCSVKNKKNVLVAALFENPQKYTIKSAKNNK